MNLAAHIASGLLLLGIVRRTLLSRRFGNRFATAAAPLAALVALLWTVHPLLTEAVTYTIQRTEVLAGMFYLLTLYCVIRGDTSRRRVAWNAAAVAACLLAVGSKEAAVSAPLMVLLYDRIFLSASWGDVFRRRKSLYAGLACTWILVIVLLPPRGRHGRIRARPTCDSVRLGAVRRGRPLSAALLLAAPADRGLRILHSANGRANRALCAADGGTLGCHRRRVSPPAVARFLGGVVLCDSGAQFERGAAFPTDSSRKTDVSAVGCGGDGRGARHVFAERESAGETTADRLAAAARAEVDRLRRRRSDRGDLGMRVFCPQPGLSQRIIHLGEYGAAMSRKRPAPTTTLAWLWWSNVESGRASPIIGKP